MNQNNKFCTQEGHQQVKVNHICTYRRCSKSRWCCSLCMSQNIHDHSISKNHIIRIAELPAKVNQDIENLKNSYLNSEYVNQIKNLLFQQIKETQELELIQDLERQLNNLISDDDNFKLQTLLNLVDVQSLQELNDDDLNQLLNINQYKFQNITQFQLLNKLDKIQQQLSMLYQNLKDQIKNIKNINNNNYEIIKIYKKEKEGYFCSQMIDKKEQYLVYNVASRINIYDIKMRKISQSKKLRINLISFQFSPDSKYLFASDPYGLVYGYFALNGFKRFYKQLIHHTYISQIIIQKQYLITASGVSKIIKTDFIKKQQIFKLVGHPGYIFSIDYDIQQDIIISTSSDKSIKVWDCANQSILIDHSENSQYKHIQFMNNKQDLMCNIAKELLKFTIDYQNKKLIQHHFYKDEQKIMAFYQVNNNQLLVIFKQYCKILDNKGVLFFIIQHNLGLDYNPYYSCNSEQLDNPNYFILIRFQDIMSITSQKLELRYYKYKHNYLKQSNSINQKILVYDVNYKIEDQSQNKRQLILSSFILSLNSIILQTILKIHLSLIRPSRVKDN